MMNKKNLPHIITVVSFVVFIVLGLACATTPTAQIELGENYRKYLLQPSGNERAFDVVMVRGNTSFVCYDQRHAVTPAQALGATYQLGGELTTKSKAAETKAPPSERHRHEPIFDRLLNEAKRQYPNETVDIRNAKTSGHYPTNTRYETYTESVKNSDGSYSSVERTRTIWDCFPVYSASIITTQPMPQPVTHSEDFKMPGATRADINRRALNWLEDNTQRRRIKIESQDFDRGRIKGTVTCVARADNTYIVTSNYTIDVYDARVEMRFTDTMLQRTDPAQQRTGNPEPIFLQSIADAAKAELVDFATSLRSYIISR
jgi:hypothetical protein